jgi:NADPH-dependent glutamate synthase beta subunit-like oxidoreductase
VTIFEKQPEPGGMMRYGIPEYRLPRDLLAREIDVVRQMGAEIKCGVTFGSDITLESLKADGYSACFMAIGLHGGRSLGVENEDSEGVLQGVDFCGTPLWARILISARMSSWSAGATWPSTWP